MRFIIEDDTLRYSTLQQDKKVWSGYTYLGTRQGNTFVYTINGEREINADETGVCDCSTEVIYQKTWMFQEDHLSGLFAETTQLSFGTPDTCPGWVFTYLPVTKITAWDGYRL
ncbi:MAG: hypothetical protein V1726_08820 [Methanobacteriota archaeon]